MPDREITYDPQMLEDLTWWQENDAGTAYHIVEVIEETQRTPEKGRGRPKRLSGIPGMWSRRLTGAHRLYYGLHHGALRFYSCRGHELAQSARDAAEAGAPT